MLYNNNHQAIIKATEMANIKKIKSPGSANKAIETMFRNAYRAQLDLLALAAMKANIMISLNGAIVSILMVASGFVYADSKTLSMLLPATLFLITSVVSIYFALSAASPSPSPAHVRLGHYLGRILRGNLNLRGIRHDMLKSNRQFDHSTSSILIFEDFSKLSKADYIDQMRNLMSEKDKVYDEMSAQLHHLGTMADRKYAMLRRSYSVFRWGVIITIIAFLLLQYFSAQQHANASDLLSNNAKTEAIKTKEEKESIQKVISQPAVALKTSSGVLHFKSIYEPSGVQQLADGRLLIVEDESTRAFRLLTPLANQKIVESKPLDVLSDVAFQRRLNDLEAITLGKDGFLYAITSHKQNNNGQRKKSREQLIRFKITGNKLTDVSIVTNLVGAINASNVLEKITKKGKQSIEKIDIEALSFDKNNQLMIGLRKPKARGKSIILSIKNPTAMFNHEEKIQIDKKVALLDLQGGGIRAMRYIPKLKGYLLANEVKTKGRIPVKHSQLSFWDGELDHRAKPLALKNVDKIDNIEGISLFTVEGKQRILLVGDNGNSEAQQPASFLLLDYLTPDKTNASLLDRGI
jgi:hypothetical protein